MKVYFKTILMLIKTQLEYRKAFIVAVINAICCKKEDKKKYYC